MSYLKYAVKFNGGWVIINDDEKSHQSPMLSCQRSQARMQMNHVTKCTVWVSWLFLRLSPLRKQ